MTHPQLPGTGLIDKPAEAERVGQPEIEEDDELATEATTVNHDVGFAQWLSQSGGSIAVSTNRGNRVGFISWNGKQVSIVMRKFDMPSGIAVQGSQMAIACRNYILMLTASKEPAPDVTPAQQGRYNSVYTPTLLVNTGSLNTHDVQFCNNSLWFVNTRFDCLASLSNEFSFVPRWMPRFITELLPEDFCHLTGLAIRDGKAGFVTAITGTRDRNKWRKDRYHSGVIINVATHEIILQGLCMPHSPRWNDNKLWFLDSAKGDFCVVDTKALNKFHVICSLPGWAHGLCFVDHYALVAHSRIRKRFLNADGPPVLDLVANRKCGVAVIDSRSGHVQGSFEFTSGPSEIFDLVFLPKTERPTMSNILSSEMNKAMGALKFTYSFTGPDDGIRGDGSSPVVGPPRGHKPAQQDVAADYGEGAGEGGKPA